MLFCTIQYIPSKSKASSTQSRTERLAPVPQDPMMTHALPNDDAERLDTVSVPSMPTGTNGLALDDASYRTWESSVPTPGFVLDEELLDGEVSIGELSDPSHVPLDHVSFLSVEQEAVNVTSKRAPELLSYEECRYTSSEGRQVVATFYDIGTRSKARWIHEGCSGWSWPNGPLNVHATVPNAMINNDLSTTSICATLWLGIDRPIEFDNDMLLESGLGEYGQRLRTLLQEQDIAVSEVLLMQVPAYLLQELELAEAKASSEKFCKRYGYHSELKIRFTSENIRLGELEVVEASSVQMLPVFVRVTERTDPIRPGPWPPHEVSVIRDPVELVTDEQPNQTFYLDHKTDELLSSRVSPRADPEEPGETSFADGSGAMAPPIRYYAPDSVQGFDPSSVSEEWSSGQPEAQPETQPEAAQTTKRSILIRRIWQTAKGTAKSKRGSQ